jgi:peptidoglycan/LPS O-acetylase OafA/YrhL
MEQDVVRTRGRRIIRLEACRGLAALVVVVGHCLNAFQPNLDFAGKIYYVFVNGEAAVILFFTLSGYVLTIRFFENPTGNYIGSAALKRLPRLALLPTIATVASASIWLLGLYKFQEAGQISGSRWLERFGMSDLPTNFDPSLPGALDQGIWRTFLAGDSYYDSSLWTMAHEFHGSLLVLAVAPFLIFVLRGRLVWLALAFSMLIFRYVNPYMMPFLCGMGIAYYSAFLHRFSSAGSTAVLLILGIYLLGFNVPEQHYSLLNAIVFWHPEMASSKEFQTLVLTIGAAAVIIAVLQSSVAGCVLNNRVGALLGFLSFPMYVMHLLIICSVSSLAYIALSRVTIVGAAWGAISCTLILTLLVSWPLGAIDALWVRYLSNKIATLLEHPEVVSRPTSGIRASS